VQKNPPNWALVRVVARESPIRLTKYRARCVVQRLSRDLDQGRLHFLRYLAQLSSVGRPVGPLPFYIVIGDLLDYAKKQDARSGPHYVLTPDVVLNYYRVSDRHRS